MKVAVTLFEIWIKTKKYDVVDFQKYRIVYQTLKKVNLKQNKDLKEEKLTENFWFSEEEKEEVFVTIFDPLEDPIEWRWEDFLPGNRQTVM